MDPITAVGFAASILNFVDFSWTLIKGAYEVYELGTTANNTRIGTVLSDLEGITKSLQSDVAGNSTHVKDLKSLAAECVKVSQELSTILKNLEMKEGNKVWRSLESKWKSMRKEKEIAAIEQKLIEYRLQLLLRLNLMLSEQQTSVKCQLDDIQETGLQLSIDGLDKLTTLHQAVQSLEQKLTGELFQALKINDSDSAANTASLFELHTSLLSLVTQLKETSSWNTAESRILKKLYFNSIHSRSETISEAEDGTFGWLLEDDSKEALLLEPHETDVLTSSSGSISSGIDSPAKSGLLDSGPPAPVSGKTDSETLENSFRDLAGSETNSLIGASDLEKPLENIHPGDTHSNESSQQDLEDGDDGAESSNDGNLSGHSKERDYPSVEEPKSKAAEKTVKYPDEIELQERTRQTFLEWLNSGNGIYHITGKAGSGKSTLMKSLVQQPRLMKELKGWAGDKKMVFGKYFSWNSGDAQQRSLEGLYRSLLFEILNQCPDLIREVFPSHWSNAQAQRPGWEDIPFLFSELREALGIIVDKHKFSNHRFCFFIDGLDEFDGESTEHWMLAQMLRRWASFDDVKICVSSRPYTEFLGAFNSSLRMQLHDLTRGDIQRFTNAKFENEPYFSVRDETFMEFVKEIVNGADGVFLWVRLVVRSLLDGARHRSSLPVLKEKLHRIPRGLDSLFDKLFNEIDPTDRERSDKMLMLAASQGAQNALMYSWLEDLENPEFPYNAAFRAYSDAEIEKRHADVRPQLDSLSKGLLEMKISSYSSAKVPDGKALAIPGHDIYFRYQVDFFHRSVRDYLQEPVRYADIQRRLGDFDSSSAYSRLLLVQFKFARTMKEYFEKQGTGQKALVSSFSRLFHHGSGEIPSRYLEECGKILDHHRQNPFSYPGETAENPGIIAWGQNWDARPGHGLLHDNDISYHHWLAHYGQHKYLMTLLSADPSYLAPSNGPSLLLTSCISPPYYELVCDLLKLKASPTDPVMVYINRGLNANRDEESEENRDEDSKETRVTTVWAAFLVIMVVQIRRQQNRGIKEKAADFFLILEEFLKLGVDNDVCFLFETNKGKTKKGEVKSDEDAMILVTLEDFILLENPPNADTLMKLVLKGKYSLLWEGTMQLLSTLRPWIGGAGGAELKHRKARLDDLFADTRDTWDLKSVCIRGDWLENNFVVGWF